MSLKMQMNTNFKKLCDHEKEIKNDWYWKFQSKKLKTILLDQIAIIKINISTSTKQHDCLQNMVENS